MKIAACGGVSTPPSISVFSFNVHQIKKYLFRLSLTANVILSLKNMP